MYEVECEKCGSPAYLSRRRGLREGILDRLMLRAVFRCSHCSRRWSEYLPDAAFKKARRAESFIEFIGCGDAKNQQVLIRIAVIALMAAVLSAGFIGLKRQRIRISDSGQRIPDPKVNKMLPRPKGQ